MDSTAGAKPVGTRPSFRAEHRLLAQKWVTHKRYNPQGDGFKYTLKVLIRTAKQSHVEQIHRSL